MRQFPIECKKYNSFGGGESLDPFTNQQSFKCLLTISQDGRKLILTKVKEKNGPTFVLEPDPRELQKMRKEYNE